jgi:hypothetical protein
MELESFKVFSTAVEYLHKACLRDQMIQQWISGVAYHWTDEWQVEIRRQTC